MIVGITVALNEYDVFGVHRSDGSNRPIVQVLQRCVHDVVTSYGIPTLESPVDFVD